jgi:hypothetical protein
VRACFPVERQGCRQRRLQRTRDTLAIDQRKQDAALECQACCQRRARCHEGSCKTAPHLLEAFHLAAARCQQFDLQGFSFVSQLHAHALPVAIRLTPRAQHERGTWGQ